MRATVAVARAWYLAGSMPQASESVLQYSKQSGATVISLSSGAIVVPFISSHASATHTHATRNSASAQVWGFPVYHEFGYQDYATEVLINVNQEGEIPSGPSGSGVFPMSLLLMFVGGFQL